MAVSMESVRAALEPDEPNYPKAAQLGPEALPHLEELARGGDPMLASKAVYLASLIPDDRSADLVGQAAQHEDSAIRAAAAAAVANLAAEHAEEILPQLVNDADPSVRKLALNAVPDQPGESLTRVLAEEGGRAHGSGLMPGEDADAPSGGSGLMPGESADALPGGSGLMPGESADAPSGGSGLMPGESAHRAQGATPGLMPGESADAAMSADGRDDLADVASSRPVTRMPGESFG